MRLSTVEAALKKSVVSPFLHLTPKSATLKGDSVSPGGQAGMSTSGDATRDPTQGA